MQLNIFSLIDTDLHARCGREKTEYSILRCMLKATLERSIYRDFVIDPGNDLGRIRLCHKLLERLLGPCFVFLPHLHEVGAMHCSAWNTVCGLIKIRIPT